MNHNSIDKETMDYCHENASMQIQNMSETIHNFMNFFKPDKEKEVFDLKTLIKKTINLIRTAVESQGIRIKQKIDEDIKVLGYPNEFGQVILNIVNNAKDAILEKKPEVKEIHVYTIIKDNIVLLNIEDTAGGIPEDIKEKVFEPYFSTKGNVELDLVFI
ncbi:HAMP domain-containing sensor histidine kinase [Hydrogenivirga sp. 128-5-R1-1]|uniref:sensor histidine kinase n=1 Tax=Hydrogenivirga sp. 128-5-R1-1 TaxID=392423 RepID=UPI00015F0D76|nr:HAMP domain-containing sensor histidine kinase [Hydrogenivirga sp. 128-5-R1-1]EDP73981.1 PAS/PAC sensor signal transduction histidine kinase [Hydrogenivirga sp. 128-5-R1-1]